MSHHNCPAPALRNRTDDLKVLTVAVLRDKMCNTSRLNDHVMDTPDLLVSYVELAIGVKTRIDWADLTDEELPEVKAWQGFCTDLFDSVLDYATQAVLNDSSEPAIHADGFVPSEDFYRVLDHTSITSVDRVEREQAIRLYCTMNGACWNLQVRAPMTLRNGKEGKDFIVASASLEKPALVALRDAADRLLRA